MSIVITNPVVLDFCKNNPLFIPEDVLLFHINIITQLHKETVDSQTVQKSLQQFMTQFQYSESNVMLNKVTQELDNIKEMLDNKQSSLIENVKNIPNPILLNQINHISHRQTADSSQLDSKINQISDNISVISNSLHGYLERLKISSVKGSATETKFQILLENAFPTHTIETVPSKKQKGRMDLSLVKDNYPTILLDLKDYSTTVPKTEVDKFEQDILLSNNHGILISPFSNISGKINFQISLINNKIGIYISKCNLDVTDIEHAVRIIYDLDKTLLKGMEQSHSTGHTINLQQMEQINTLILENVEKMKKLKSHLSLALQQCDVTMFDSLKQMLGIMSEKKEETIQCKICLKIFPTKRSISSHLRFCKNTATVPASATANSNLDEQDNQEKGK